MEQPQELSNVRWARNDPGVKLLRTAALVQLSKVDYKFKSCVPHSKKIRVTPDEFSVAFIHLNFAQRGLTALVVANLGLAFYASGPPIGSNS